MIEITVTIKAGVKEVWDKWTSVDGVRCWAFASDDWAAEGLENDVRPGGQFKSRNFAKDGSAEFLFEGTYNMVEPEKYVSQTLSDGRKVEVAFTEASNGTTMTQRFEPETENSEQMQRDGWQAYLNNFKKFVESSMKS